MRPTRPDCDPALRALRLQRFVLAVLPAVVLVTLAFTTVWGSNGLLARRALRVELEAERAELAAVHRAIQGLVWDARTLERDAIVVERIVADELEWAQPDATLYRFEDPERR